MKIQYSCFQSALSYDQGLRASMTAFLAEVENELGATISEAPLEEQGADLKLLYIVSGGSEGLFLQNIEKLQSPYYLLTNGSNNSLAASLEILTYLREKGLPGEIIHGTPEYCAKRIRFLAKKEKLRKDLAALRLGVYGKPSDWLIASIPDYAEVKRKLGVALVDVPLSEVEKGFALAKGAAPLPGEFAPSEKQKAVRIEEAFEAILQEKKLDGFTVRCFDLLSSLHSTGCYGLSALNDKGYIATCEGDIAAMLSMAIASRYAGEATFQANPSRIDVEKRRVVFAHCTVPLSMTESHALDTHFESGIGLAIQGRMREEDVTVLRLSADLKRFFVQNGRILRNLHEKDLCRTQIEVEFEKDISCLLQDPCGNHHVIFYGHHAEELDAILRDWLA